MPADDRVLCILRNEFESTFGEGVSGFLPYGPDGWNPLFQDDDATAWIPRDKAETSEDWIQLIPYAYAARSGALLWYRRKGGDEARLDGRYSVGFGGHVEPKDAGYPIDCIPPIGGPEGPMDSIGRALRREWTEEVGNPGPDFKPIPVGLIYDPSEPVGRVHLGFVYGLAGNHIDLSALAVTGTAFGWANPATLAAGRNSAEAGTDGGSALERWSRYVVGRIAGKLESGVNGWSVLPE